MTEPEDLIIEEDIEEPEPVKVYVWVDDQNRVTAVSSSVFLSDTTGWTQIDSGHGDRYAHAQSQYLEKGLMDDQGCYNYALVDGEIVERTTEEKQAEIDARPEPEPTPEEKISALEEKITQTETALLNSEAQVTDLQIALVEVYEILIGGIA